MRHLKKFLLNCSGATAIEYGLLVSLISLMLIGTFAVTGERVRTLFESLSFQLTRDQADEVAVTWPSILMAPRRLPRNPDHPTLWAIPFHVGALPEGFPVIGGQEFSISGDGNPRMLLAGADPRVISGETNPQFDSQNYAGSGIAYGSSTFHRILIDTPPVNTTYTVNLRVGGQIIQYEFINIPY